MARDKSGIRKLASLNGPVGMIELTSEYAGSSVADHSGHTCKSGASKFERMSHNFFQVITHLTA
jgi:hypothetical protein